MSTANFSDNFWETIDKNGIAILMERMRGAKQTCEKIKHAYEARAILEEHYGKTLMQIYQKQKLSHTENGSTKLALESMQQEMISIAESHIQLSQLIRNTVAATLSTLLNKQKTIKKELQTSIQKLYNNRQHRIQVVRKAHKRHNFEIEKANLLVQQQSDEKEKLTIFQTAKTTIDKLKTEYDQALLDLENVIVEWNKEWKKTCQSFEDLEKERLEFFKTNLSNYAHLMIGCLEDEIKACEKINEKTEHINVSQDLIDFVNENKSSQIEPSSMEYIKLAAYHEANGGKNEHKHADHDEPSKPETPHIPKVDDDVVVVVCPKEDPIVINKKEEEEEEKQPVMMMGIMEVYPSDEEESDSEEYITESESEPEEEDKAEEEEEHKPPTAAPAAVVVAPNRNSVSESLIKTGDDEKVSKLRTAYQEIRGTRQPGNTLTSSRRVSFIETSTQQPTETAEQSPTHHSSTLMDRYKRSIGSQPQDFHTSAALELDDMLRELDSKRIHREDRQQPEIKPTVSMSSPSHLEKQQPRLRRPPLTTTTNKPNQFDRRRQSQIVDTIKSSHMDFYDPFNSLSSKETDATTQQHKMRQASPPSAQTMYDRMLTHNNKRSSSSSTSPQDTFVETFYSIGSKTPSPFTPEDSQFIDFALAQYDYEASDKGEIEFKEGDLLGIISKGEDGGEGWWEASVLNPRTQKIVRTGLVPSNFLETISK